MSGCFLDMKSEEYDLIGCSLSNAYNRKNWIWRPAPPDKVRVEGSLSFHIGSNFSYLPKADHQPSSNSSFQRPIGPIHPPHLYHQMGSGEREMVSLYEQGLVNPYSSNMANTDTNSSGVSQHDWPMSFINNNNVSNRASDASLWSTISTTIGGNSERTSTSGVGAGSSSFVKNQWPNLPGYGPPP
ncbi:hypothetical protein JHK85_045479 [Glycine max]|nr:hypothetical protein JHK85_045479 [Glycine max]